MVLPGAAAEVLDATTAVDEDVTFVADHELVSSRFWAAVVMPAMVVLML